MVAKYQVFVSSTYEDLVTQRDQVIKAVLEMGHIPVGMEMFSAADEEQWKIIARHIDESDYYVVVIAHRLGSLTPEGISYTRKEYEYAKGQGVPCLGFILEEGASWLPAFIDGDGDAKAGLDDFKALVREKPVGFWSTNDDLHAKVSIALNKAFIASPRTGWVRASESPGPAVMAELTRLSSENAALRKDAAERAKAIDEDERSRLGATITRLGEIRRTPHYRRKKNGEWYADVEISLLRAFRVLAPEMVIESSVNSISVSLAMELCRDSQDEGWHIVATNQTKDILADFLTLDLLAPSERRHAVSDSNEYWSLTSEGVALLKRIRLMTINDGPHNSGDEPVDDAVIGDLPTSLDDDYGEPPF